MLTYGQIDIFSKDVVFMPVNHGNAHWTTAAINFRQKRFESYDSMGMAKEHVFRVSGDVARWNPRLTCNRDCAIMSSWSI